MRKKRKNRDDDMDINVTPMLDIVFIMLIFFIVTTSFVKDPGIDPVRPTAETTQPKPRGNILIGVSPNGHIWMNNRRIELEDVRQLVEDTVKEIPESSAILISDQGAPTGVIIDVMDQVRAGGVNNVSIAATPEST